MPLRWIALQNGQCAYTAKLISEKSAVTPR